mmetsp:Transcript_8537/g.17811  ORF Transcript_8537/g.17811 Transcript_8537/m.17811 type:complete len:133 (+) Transcript_8537:78-476(+)
MVSTLRQRLGMLLTALCMLLVITQRVESFQIGSSVAKINSPTSRLSSNHVVSVIEQERWLSTPASTTALNAKKKKVVEEEPVREKKNALELVLLYMTPWRNPNSIFLYMFGALYFLGKYSEAHNVVRASGGL